MDLWKCHFRVYNNTAAQGEPFTESLTRRGEEIEPSVPQDSQMSVNRKFLHLDEFISHYADNGEEEEQEEEEEAEEIFLWPTMSARVKERPEVAFPTSLFNYNQTVFTSPSASSPIGLRGDPGGGEWSRGRRIKSQHGNVHVSLSTTYQPLIVPSLRTQPKLLHSIGGRRWIAEHLHLHPCTAQRDGGTGSDQTKRHIEL